MNVRCSGGKSLREMTRGGPHRARIPIFPALTLPGFLTTVSDIENGLRGPARLLRGWRTRGRAVRRFNFSWKRLLSVSTRRWVDC